jgi:multicomponent Na+:H+ antiporter subunit E
MSLILKPVYGLWLFIVFLWDLLTSSIQVAIAVLLPGERTRPRLVSVPLRARSGLEITLVANFISLTPGTLSVDVSEDRETLLVHDLFAGESGDGTRAGVRDGIEARVIRATRA